LRRGRLSEPARRWGRPAQLRPRRRAPREHRSGGLVHVRGPPRGANRGLAGHARHLHRLLAETGRLLRSESRSRRATTARWTRGVRARGRTRGARRSDRLSLTLRAPRAIPVAVRVPRLGEARDIWPGLIISGIVVLVAAVVADAMGEPPRGGPRLVVGL